MKKKKKNVTGIKNKKIENTQREREPFIQLKAFDRVQFTTSLVNVSVVCILFPMMYIDKAFQHRHRIIIILIKYFSFQIVHM